MSTKPPIDPERPALAGDDARLLARVREAFAPEPMTPFERTAFDARLQERIERRRRRLGLWPALGAGLVAASLAMLLLVREEANGPPTPGSVAIATSQPRPASPAWAADLLYGDDDELDEDDGLPAEYAAIAGVFLDL